MEMNIPNNEEENMVRVEFEPHIDMEKAIEGVFNTILTEKAFKAQGEVVYCMFGVKFDAKRVNVLHKFFKVEEEKINDHHVKFKILEEIIDMEKINPTIANEAWLVLDGLRIGLNEGFNLFNDMIKAQEEVLKNAQPENGLKISE